MSHSSDTTTCRYYDHSQHQRTRRPTVSCWHFLALALICTSTHARSSLPRSSKTRRYTYSTPTDQPPWNPSSLIDSDGFLKGLYGRCEGEWEQEVRVRTAYGTDLPCQVRQVPGDGNCLFHSLSLCLHFAQNGTHWDMSSKIDELYQHSQQLRKQAVACLRQGQRKLFLQGRESLRAHELVTAAALQYEMTPEEYCTAMEEECVWGGGPEIVALCNLLRRPIHVYELSTRDDSNKDHSSKHNQLQKPAFVLKRMACFGSPRFDGRQALHILSADSRFPDLAPGQQMSAGNHFLAVFPLQRAKKRRRLRGGALRPKQRKRDALLSLEEDDLIGEDSQEKERIALPQQLLRLWKVLHSVWSF